MRATTIWCVFVLSGLVRGQQSVEQRMQGIEEAEDAEFEQRLLALAAEGPKAAAAVPPLLKLAQSRKLPPERLVPVIEALAELAPFRDADQQIDPRQLMMATQMAVARSRGSLSVNAAIGRLSARGDFPQDLSIDDLVLATRAHNPWTVEVVVDLLWSHGTAAHAALPALRALLERPEPRILLGEGTVPIHRKVARAVAAIEPDGDVAKLAAQTLAHPPVGKAVVVPQRLQERIDALLVELGAPETRAQAAANLKAIGSSAVGSIVAALSKDQAPEVWTAALDLLRELGPDATAALPRLYEATWSLPSSHTVAVLEALTTIAPWSWDRLPDLSGSSSTRSITIAGHAIQGEITLELLNAYMAASMRYHTALKVDPDAPLAELGKKLDSPSVAVREFALLAIRRRGAEARSLLPVLGAMLDAEQPKERRMVFQNATSARPEAFDHTDTIQRLAAEAILAIAPSDDPRNAAAKARLAK